MVHERDTPMENNYNVVNNQKYQEIESLYPEALNEFLLNFGEKLLEGDISDKLWFRWGGDRIVIIPIHLN